VYSAGFIWDDDFYVENNPTFKEEGGLAKIWYPGIDQRDIHPITKQYYPLTYTSLYLEYQLWGDSPAGYHVVNVLLHIMAAFLLWRVLLQLEIRSAWWGAMAFAVHPLCVESVAWITERKNTLSAVFFFAALLLYLKNRLDTENKPSIKIYASVVLLYVFALLSKSVTCTLPAVMLLLMWWKRPQWKLKSYLHLILLFAIGLLAGLNTIFMEVNKAKADWDPSIVERLLLVGRTPCFYIQKIIFPDTYMFFYPRWQLDSSNVYQYLFPLITLGALLLLWKKAATWGRGPLIAYLIFLALIFPASGLFNVYPFKFSFVADHFQYLASTAIIVLVVSVLDFYIEKFKQSDCKNYIFAGLLVMLLAKTVFETQKFDTKESLWLDTISKNSECWTAHEELAHYYLNKGETQRAVVSYQNASAIRSNTDNKALVMLARISDRYGQYDDAVLNYTRYLAIHPEDSNTKNSLAVALTNNKAYERAEVKFKELIKDHPHSPIYHINYAFLFSQQGEYEKMVDEYAQVLALTRKSIITKDTVRIDYVRVLKILEAEQKKIPDDFVEARKRLQKLLDEFRNSDELLNVIQRDIKTASP